MSITILVAANAFKGGLEAPGVCEAIAAGLEGSPLECRPRVIPIGDGGDGTGALLASALRCERIDIVSSDALRRPIDSHYWWKADERLAIIELADTIGLKRLSANELDPLAATSTGAGETILHALDHGARRVWLCAGGTATVDGGAGILRSLGVRFLNAAGAELPNRADALLDLALIDQSGRHPALTGCEITVLCDVQNPLLGPTGAAAVFAPQKGANAAGVALLEKALKRCTDVYASGVGQDFSDCTFAGAAGGCAWGLAAFAGARLVSGIDHYLDRLEFDFNLVGADLVVTGEGRIDEQTLGGKAPFGVALRAKRQGVPVFALGGAVPVRPSCRLRETFDLILPISNEPAELDAAIALTADNLRRTAHELGRLINRVGTIGRATTCAHDDV